MFNLQLYKALETYHKWFSYHREQFPLTALLVLTCVGIRGFPGLKTSDLDLRERRTQLQ
jgi:hypothetical protein